MDAKAKKCLSIALSMLAYEGLIDENEVMQKAKSYEELYEYLDKAKDAYIHKKALEETMRQHL